MEKKIQESLTKCRSKVLTPRELVIARWKFRCECRKEPFVVPENIKRAAEIGYNWRFVK